MKIDHLAVWCDDLESMRAFYLKYFDCTSGPIYRNASKRYSSYFLMFGSDGCRLELMCRTDIVGGTFARGFMQGLAHFDIVVGDRAVVDRLVERLDSDGYTVLSEPRSTGDG